MQPKNNKDKSTVQIRISNVWKAKKLAIKLSQMKLIIVIR